MALPVTISGIATSPACVGPFKSSGGNYYFFGKDGTTATTLQAYKATDPTSSWSSIATNTGFSTAVQAIAGYQSGDTIHLAIIDGATTSVNLKYRTFNMATDAFVTSETVHSAFNPQTSGSANVYACSIVFRSSDSQPIILYNGPQVASMGSSYSRIVYARRTGTNTWTTNVAVDAGGTTNFTVPEVVLGASSSSHFFWKDGINLNQRTLNSSNTLQTASTGAVINSDTDYQGVSYSSGGATKVAVSLVANPNSGSRFAYFDSANTPTINLGSSSSSPGGVGVDGFTRAFVDGTDLWNLYDLAAADDLAVAKSTDHGATSGSDATVFTGTVQTGDGLSRDGLIYQRGNNFVIPYIFNDNGTLKYNEYTVRSLGTTLTAASGSYSLTGTAAGVVVARKVVAAAGSYAFTGTAATLRRNAPVIAAAGSYSLSGQAASVVHTWKAPAAAGTYTFTGTAANVNKGQSLVAAAGSYSFTGTSANIVHSWKVIAGAGSYAFTGTAATLRRNVPVVAGSGSYTLTGASASIVRGVRVTAAFGSYTFSGTAASVLRSRFLSVAAGQYNLTGTAAAVIAARKLTAAAGSYLFTGSSASIIAGAAPPSGAGDDWMRAIRRRRNKRRQ